MIDWWIVLLAFLGGALATAIGLWVWIIRNMNIWR